LELLKVRRKRKNQQALEHFLSGIQIFPIFPAFDIYASEKARLQKSGSVIDDFDLLEDFAKPAFCPISQALILTKIPGFSKPSC